MAVHAYLLQCVKCHRTGFPFQHENSETLQLSAINDWRSMLAMFLTVLYEVESLESGNIEVGFTAIMA